jgi:site-specific DNA-methyltransferase (adenine-specific)
MITSEVFNEDCMAVMARYPDNHFDLAVVDPPYGININPNMGLKKGQKKRHNSIEWDNIIPPPEYFKDLFRVSKNQIIWGGNYFPLPPTRHFIFWDKMNPEGLSFSDGEMAWTSFDRAIRKWSRRNAIDGKIHPTQKPVALYDWIFKNYATKNDTILDTHLGSGSSRIAAYRAGLEFVGCEIDEEYFEKAEQRFKNFVSQLNLF